MLSTDDTTGDEAAAESLLETVGLSISPSTDIRIFSILYYGTENDITYRTLEDLAARTNGGFVSVRDGSVVEDIAEMMYSW